MVYREYIPSNEITHFVECYWHMDHDEPMLIGKESLTIPDGTIDVVFSFGDAYTRTHLHDQLDKMEVRTSALIGQSTDTRRIAIGKKTSLLSIRFKPFGLFPLVGMNMSELNDRCLSIGEVFGKPGLELEDKLFTANSMEQRIQLIESFLLERIARSEGVEPMLRRAVSQILISRGRLKIRDLVIDLGMSKSSLEKKFEEKVGITPKSLANIWRFNDTLLQKRQKPEMSLTELAFSGNYYDQSHLIKDFKRYTGNTPGAFFIQEDPLLPALESGSFHRFNGDYMPK